MNLPPLQKRAVFLLFFLFIWAIVIIVHLFYYSVYNAEKYRKKGIALSERAGIIPAARGKIYDSNRKKLAWNEIYFDLYLKPYDGFPGRRKLVFKALSKIFGKIENIENENTVCIVKGMSPKEQIKCVDLIKYYPELYLRPRVIRRRYTFKSKTNLDNSEINSIIGKVKQVDGQFYGVNGLEKRYDKDLSGETGRFKVMVDRFGNWIPGTWKELKKARAGKDIILDISIKELIKENKEKCQK